MSILSDAEKLAKGIYVRCSCNNVYLLQKAHCPFCGRFNHASDAKHCAVCGAEKDNWISEPEPKE